MQFYIIRHCQSENNALWSNTGSSSGRFSDPGLTAIGHQQAALLAQYLAGSGASDTSIQDNRLDHPGIDLSHLYCSLMSRSIESALYISENLELPLVALENIHERGGIYLDDPITEERNGLAGHNKEYFRQNYPALILPDTLGAEGWWNRPYEDTDTAIIRAKAFLEWLLVTYDGTDERVAVVTHAGFVQSLFSVLFDIPPLDMNLGSGRRIWLNANNGSITRIDFHDNVVRLVYQNRIEYLPAALVT